MNWRSWEDLPKGNPTIFTGSVIIFDVDGTLADVEKRVKLASQRGFDWDVFLDPIKMKSLDKPNTDVVDLAKLFHLVGAKIIVVSARNERHREVTTEQLLGWGVPFERLYLRKDNDFRKDSVVKEEILSLIRKDGYNPILAVDDRQQVVDTWDRLGIICWQVRQTAV